MKSVKTEIKDQKWAARQAAASSYGTVAIADNRPLSVHQRKLRETINHQSAEIPLPRKKTDGLPYQLKSGIESLSGYSMDDVNVHYNSSKPAQLQAHAYAQGTDIHLAPGQEKHLPHEAWHVVQQKQGKVRPTFQFKRGVNINDDVSLEREADLMGEKAHKFSQSAVHSTRQLSLKPISTPVFQRIRKSDDAMVGIEIETSLPVLKPGRLEAIKDNDSEDRRKLQAIRLFYQKEVDTNDIEEYQDELMEPVNSSASLSGHIFFIATNFQGILDYRVAGKSLSQDFIENSPEIEGYEEGTEANAQKFSDLVFNTIFKGLDRNLSAGYDPGYNTSVFDKEKTEQGWEAKVDHTPLLIDEKIDGNLFTNAAVEIVTVPVKSREDATVIIDHATTWLNSIVSQVLQSADRYIEVEGFGYYIPEDSEKRIFENKELLGNIQVNIGAKLNDLIAVHDGNMDQISLDSRNYYSSLHKAITSDTFLDGVTGMMGMYSEKKLDEADKDYLKNIAFYYLYTIGSAVIGRDHFRRKSTMKNWFPILSKTPIGKQIELSDWANKDWWEEKSFRDNFYQAITDTMKFLSRKLYKREEILEELELKLTAISDNKDPYQIRDINTLDQQNLLQINSNETPAMYAGVYELRDIQDELVPQKEWIKKWHEFLPE